MKILKGKFVALLFVGGMTAMTATTAAQADEAAVLKACEISLCKMISTKQAEGDNIKCDVTKTWGSKEISEGDIGKNLSWSWGDAKCSVNVELNRKSMATALTADKGNTSMAATPVTCLIGSGDAKDALNFTLAPSIDFEKGVATKVTLGLADIKGPFMQRVALKTAALIDKTNLFQGLMVKEVNKFITKCPHKVKAAGQ